MEDNSREYFRRRGDDPRTAVVLSFGGSIVRARLGGQVREVIRS